MFKFVKYWLPIESIMIQNKLLLNDIMIAHTKYTNQILLLVFIITSDVFFYQSHTISSEDNLAEHI
jgi:hypothetical protein